MGFIVIVKVGSTLPALAARKGDFEAWASAELGVGEDQAVIVDVCAGEALPAYDVASGIVVTGSHAFVTEHKTWSERTAQWLAGAVEWGTPILGICYGHQLLAYALGGEVGDNPQGREFGTVEVHLSARAQDDVLLGGLPSPLHLQVAHNQSVLRLPIGARRLASSEMDQNQAFVVGESAWGVQFHPEFDDEVVVTYIEHFADVLIAEGHDPSELATACFDTPYGSRILRRFAQIAGRVA